VLRSMCTPLAGKVALVTGASRGVGRGIALQLAQAGATVIITGREPAKSFAASHADFSSLPSLEQTKRDIVECGGKAIALYCDHADPAEVKQLFEKIDRETEGRLDILVNNVYSAITELNNSSGRKFYELEPSTWDAFNNVGLRNHYYCAVYACRAMMKRNSGLIVNISSFAGLTYAFNVPYGCGATALDRMAADMAEELKGTGISTVCLWLGGVKTEAAQALFGTGDSIDASNEPEVSATVMAAGESTQFAGKCIVALASDPKVSRQSGKVLMTNDVARKYGFKDVDGKMPMDFRSLQVVLSFLGSNRLAAWIPSCIRIPHSLLHYASYKF
ncbi:hypothetical protein PENTCL1PPCAC_13950, partial [Pristionchus entomophagus]